MQDVFEKKKAEKNTVSNNKMAAPEASVFTRLEIVFVTISPFTKLTKVVHKEFKED